VSLLPLAHEWRLPPEALELALPNPEMLKIGWAPTWRALAAEAWRRSPKIRVSVSPRYGKATTPALVTKTEGTSHSHHLPLA
jgi:hypothetical protein